MAECKRNSLQFHPHGRRQVVAEFDGGKITSDAGGLLLREVDQTFGVIRRFAACFRDCRDPDLIEHPLEQLLAQRVMGIALGYEDLNDHDELRHDPLMALLCGRDDLSGVKRKRPRDRGKALAGRNTLNRLTPALLGQLIDQALAGDPEQCSQCADQETQREPEPDIRIPSGQDE